MYIVRNPKDQHNLPFWKTNICFNFHFTSTIHLQSPWVRKPKHCIHSWHKAQRLGSERGTVRYVSGHVPIIKLHSLTLNSIFLHYIQILQTKFSFTSWLLIRLWSRGFWKRIGKLEEGKKMMLACFLFPYNHSCNIATMAVIPVRVVDNSWYLFNTLQRGLLCPLGESGWGKCHSINVCVPSLAGSSSHHQFISQPAESQLRTELCDSYNFSFQFPVSGHSSVQSLSRVQLFVTP